MNTVTFPADSGNFTEIFAECSNFRESVLNKTTIFRSFNQMKIGMLDLRNEVVVAVQGIENEDLLRRIMELILSGNRAEPYALSDEQNARIEISRQQYENGQVKSHKSAMEETKQWLLSK